MKINNLKINGFGKLKDKNIEFSNEINLIYGKNESGKSTMLKFILSMLYGASKNKNGKEISDFDRFKPLCSDEYSGKIEYTLDNGENFEIYKEFKKKNPIIYNSLRQDISKNFNIDKAKGIDFFTEQTGIDEETFYNTAIMEQENVKLDRASQNNIIQKISNIVSSGNDNISFKKALDKINKRQNDEVGTERTLQKPINIVNNKIDTLLEEKKSLEIYRENCYNNEIEKEQLRMNIQSEEIKIDFLKDLKVNLENNRIKIAEINFNKNLENDYNKKIEVLNKRRIDTQNINSKKNKNNLVINILLGLLIIILVSISIFSDYSFTKFVAIIPAIIIVYNLIINNKKNNVDIDKIKNEIEIIKQNIELQKKEINEKENKLSIDIEKKNKDLLDKFIKYLDIGFIDSFLNKKYEDILKEIDSKESEINNLKLRLNKIELINETVNNKLENLAKLDEELENSENYKEELISLNKSFNIAKECLEKAYSQIKERISPKFTENLCSIVSEISNGKYKNVIFSDNEGLNVEISNGSYVPVSRLSTGTIDQMYISLRLSTLNEISNEKLPIIFDEAFVYFDSQRLENILRYLKEYYKDNQIIIFTCSNREKNILDKLNIEYNTINLEK